MPLSQCHLLIAVLLAFVSSRAAFASGWNDYELSIDSRYKIVRCNSLDVCLSHTDGSSIYHPQDHACSGPIVGYDVTATHIFLRTLSRSPRNLFQGDTFEEVDISKEFFFILNTSNDNLTGPLSTDAFHSDPAVKKYGRVKWTSPRNPNVARPFVGSLMFLVISVIILGWPILLGIGVIAVIWFAVRSRRRKHTFEA